MGLPSPGELGSRGFWSAGLPCGQALLRTDYAGVFQKGSFPLPVPVIERVVQKRRHGNRWSRIRNPEINPHKEGQFISDKDAKIIQCRKENLFNK